MLFQKTAALTPTVIVRKKRPASASGNTTLPTPREGWVHTSPQQSKAPETVGKKSSRKTSSGMIPVAPPVEPTQLTSKKKRQLYADQALLAVFRERWPQFFPADVRQIKPLALGIHQVLIGALPDIKPWRIRRVLTLWQRNGNGAYWRTVLKGGPRYTLEGMPQGEITPRDQAYAREQLVFTNAWLKTKRKKGQQSQNTTDQHT